MQNIARKLFGDEIKTKKKGKLPAVAVDAPAHKWNVSTEISGVLFRI